MNDEKNEVIDNSNENSNIEELNVFNNNELDSENQENVMGNDDNTKKEKKGGRKVLILIIIILLIYIKVTYHSSQRIDLELLIELGSELCIF